MIYDDQQHPVDGGALDETGSMVDDCDIAYKRPKFPEQ